jgi:hypothetical protein
VGDYGVMMTLTQESPFGPIQRVLMRGTALDLEDEIAEVRILLAEEDPNAVDVSSIVVSVERKESELHRVCELLTSDESLVRE